MTAAEFAEKLRSQAESYEDLRLQGLSDAGARQNIEMYNCIWKGTENDYGDELLNLISNYDVKKVVIGLVRFGESIEVDGDYYILGLDEADPLVMYRFNKEISIRDHTDFDFVVCECAENGDKFLDALIAFGDFIVKISDLDFDATIDPALISSKIEECTQLAGGEKYRSYYESIIN